MAGVAKFWEIGKKAIAIGRNYAAHAKELSNPVPTTPFWFIKPTSSYVKEGSAVQIPDGLHEIDFETELAVVIGKTAKNISAQSAMQHIGGYCLTLDMTARQWQAEAKSKGLPWTAAKCFDTSLPHGAFIPLEEVLDPHNLTLWMHVNGEERQNGTTAHMIFRIPELLEVISRVHTLEPGDLVLTGTPSGVGPVKRGDVMTAGIRELGHSMRFPVE